MELKPVPLPADDPELTIPWDSGTPLEAIKRQAAQLTTPAAVEAALADLRQHLPREKSSKELAAKIVSGAATYAEKTQALLKHDQAQGRIEVLQEYIRAYAARLAELETSLRPVPVTTQKRRRGRDKDPFTQRLNETVRELDAKGFKGDKLPPALDVHGAVIPFHWRAVKGCPKTWPEIAKHPEWKTKYYDLVYNALRRK